jgi:two-component system chemotaxis response regulator CheY
MFPVDAKIMIVDDSTFSRTALKKGLRDLTYWKILEAADAKLAKDMFLEKEQQDDPVHLLICDIHMPTMSGIELVRWLRTQESTKNLPVIILTSSQDRAEILEAGKIGVSHYMVKPFDAVTLKDKINSTWHKHGQAYFESTKRMRPQGA